MIRKIKLNVIFLLRKIRSKIWQRRNCAFIPVLDQGFYSADNLILAGWANSANIEVRFVDVLTGREIKGVTKRVNRSDLPDSVGFESFFRVSDFKQLLFGQSFWVELVINNKLSRVIRKIEIYENYELIRRSIAQDFSDGKMSLNTAVQSLLPSLSSENVRRQTQPNSIDVLYDSGNECDEIDLLIVVPLFGNVGLVEHQLLLFGRFKHEYPQHRLQIVYVVDDPDLRDVAKSRISLLNETVFNLPVVVICNEFNCGFALACNNGFQFKKSKFTMFWNSDLYSENPADLLAILRKLESDEKTVAVSPVLCNPDGVVQCTFLYRCRHPEYSDYVILQPAERGMSFTQLVSNTSNPEILTGGALAVRSAIFKQVGGFPTNYGQGDFEDGELTIRLSKFGRLEVVYVPFYHLEGSSFRRNVLETFCRSILFSQFCSSFGMKELV